MKISIDSRAGFCWGVVRTIDVAEKMMEGTERLFSLGPVIHNPMEIERLRRRGLEVVSPEDFPKLRGATVLIRAHGEPPATYAKAREFGITLVDATCPVVTKVQERIRRFYERGYQIVIFGKKDHAEVVGLVGNVDGKAIVIRSLEEADAIDCSRKTVLFSQTTMDKATFHLIADRLRERIKEFEIGSMEDTAVEFHAKDTICGQVAGRDAKLREFSRENDVVVFVAGKNSSNGKILFDICRAENPRTYFVERAAELEEGWFRSTDRVGITGATSTPQWLMAEVGKAVEEFSVITK